MADDPDSRLRRIEATIASERLLYIQCVSTCRQGEAEWHETRVDRLLALWDHIRRGEPLTAEETQMIPS